VRTARTDKTRDWGAEGQALADCLADDRETIVGRPPLHMPRNHWADRAEKARGTFYRAMTALAVVTIAVVATVGWLLLRLAAGIH
jgi:hypothetical protein